VSNALPYSMSNLNVARPGARRSSSPSEVPPAPASRPRAVSPWSIAPANRMPMPVGHGGLFPRPTPRFPPLAPYTAPQPAISLTTPERMLLARERIQTAAEAGQRIRSYEVALDLDLSEFHFARQFRAAFGRSPHVFYDEVRAERARVLLRDGLPEGDVARRVGFRRPAELRALLNKRAEPATV
jgi:AraC-like DNA-binding protein